MEKPVVKLPLGEFKKLSKNISLTTILLILLIAAAFFIGSLRTEVNYLKGGVKGQAAPTVSAPTAAQPAQAPGTIAPTGKVPEVTDRDHIRGNKNAQVMLIEYSDMECPFCKQFHPTMKQVLATYGDKVAWVYRHYPLAFHANAQKEAEAAECVAEQGGNDKFWQFVDTIFDRTTSNGTGFALDKLAPLAAEVGVDQTKFQSCLDSGKYTKAVGDQLAGGQAAGVNGTPGTFVIAKDGSSQLIPGALPFEQVKTTIDNAFKK
ncbi:MAG: DsbA family protein [Dehalococcoidales bacterium]|nr:DsbA family protein [Dehalococcoidales bacterium]